VDGQSGFIIDECVPDVKNQEAVRTLVVHESLDK
jgi:hypothetical protein